MQAPDLDAVLATPDTEVDARWNRLAEWVGARYGRTAGLEALLFLIGVQESGRGFAPNLAKEAKQDVIMQGTYAAFERVGLYHRVGAEADGSDVWERSEAVPYLSPKRQEKLLRLAVLAYFDDVVSDAA